MNQELVELKGEVEKLAKEMLSTRIFLGFFLVFIAGAMLIGTLIR